MHILSCSQTSMCFVAWNSVWRNVEEPSQNTSGEILSNGEDNDMALRVVQLLMAHFGEDLTGLILLTDVSFIVFFLTLCFKG